MSSPSSMARNYFRNFNSRVFVTDLRSKSSIGSELNTAYADGHGARVHVHLFRPNQSPLSSDMLHSVCTNFPLTYSTFIVKNGRNYQNYLESIYTYWYIVTCHKNTSYKNINWQLFVYYLCLLSWICRKNWSFGWWILSNFHKKLVFQTFQCKSSKNF